MFRLKKQVLILIALSSYLSAVHAQQVRISTPGLPLLQQATLIKPLDANTSIHFTAWLKLRNKARFDQRVRDIYDPNSANYQKFLTRDVFKQNYAPSEYVKNKVLHYFAAQGMHTQLVNNKIRVTATAQQIEQGFLVKMNTYNYQNQRVYANDQAPTLRADIAPYILEITGLNNLVHYQPAVRARPHYRTDSAGIKPHDVNLAWESFTPFAQPTTTSFAGFSGAQLQTTYNLAQIAPIQGQTINGAGQTLVIIDACGTNTPKEIMDNANRYNTANGIAPLSAANFQVIASDGTPFTTCAHSSGSSWNSEIALDVEASHTLAPGANTVLVLAQTDDAPLDEAVDNVINILINNNYTIAGFPNAYVVSNSWGISEVYGRSAGMETMLEIAAAHGISFNFSTGDCGDGTYNSTWPCSKNSAQANVQYPASSAFTTAVGGTSAFVDNNWNYAFETLWGSYYDGAYYGGTTGGISQFYGPVAWQSSISNFLAGGYTLGSVGAYAKRALPDIAMLADPYTGLTIYVSHGSLVYGGTSLACPLFSATQLLVNQERMLLNGGTPKQLGQAAPYLYTQNTILHYGQGLRLISPPHLIIDGAKPAPVGAPSSAFKIYLANGYDYYLTFGWDSSMSIEPENQFWNDGVGVGSPNLPNFVPLMAVF